MRTPKQLMTDLPPEDRAFYVEMAAAAIVATAFVLAI